MTRKPLVAGNWKMNNTLPEARALMKGIRDQLDPNVGVDVVVCPPFTLLYPMGKELHGTKIALGAQDVYYATDGAYTGEISPGMLKAAGCRYVIVGHSERRHRIGEKGQMLRRKLAAAIEGDLDVIYCVGETLMQREESVTEPALDLQITEVLEPDVDPTRVIVAYEPVWAIGTGRTATPEIAQEAHAFIRLTIGGIYGEAVGEGMRILYGGSVKPDNAAELIACPDVDGALVGGACLVAEDFVAIISAADEARSRE